VQSIERVEVCEGVYGGAGGQSEGVGGALRITLNNNAALMCIKLSHYEGAIKAASDALAVKGASDESKAKAYFRRGQAKVYKKDEDDALEDLEQARKLMPNDAAVRKELASMRRKAAERRQKEKAAYSKFSQ